MATRPTWSTSRRRSSQLSMPPRPCSTPARCSSPWSARRPPCARERPRRPRRPPATRTPSARPRPTRWRSTSAVLDTSSSEGPPGSTAGEPASPARSSRSGFRDALEGVLPRERFDDQRVILGGAAQNVLGLVVGVVANFAAQVLMTRSLGAALFGVVTVATQVAFVGSAATRFGMDVANVRLVAILMGQGERGRVRGLVRRSVLIATVVSVSAGILLFAFAGPVARAMTSLPEAAIPAFQAAALTLPFAAVAQTYLGATRGLKIMRHTLYIFWVGQNFGWIGVALLGWLFAKTAGVTTLAYAASWAMATVLAWWAWERETRGFTERTGGRG